MNAKKFHRALEAGLGLAALVLLGGCANSPSWGAWSKRPTDAQVAAVMARTAGPTAISQQEAPARPETLLAATSR
jgi:hypothetical protein